MVPDKNLIRSRQTHKDIELLRDFCGIVFALLSKDFLRFFN